MRVKERPPKAEAVTPGPGLDEPSSGRLAPSDPAQQNDLKRTVSPLAPIAKELLADAKYPTGPWAAPKLNTRQAAQYLGLGVSTTQKLRMTDKGPPYLKIGRRVVYNIDDLERWAQRMRRTQTGDVIS